MSRLGEPLTASAPLRGERHVTGTRIATGGADGVHRDGPQGCRPVWCGFQRHPPETLPGARVRRPVTAPGLSRFSYRQRVRVCFGAARRAG